MLWKVAMLSWFRVWAVGRIRREAEMVVAVQGLLRSSGLDAAMVWVSVLGDEPAFTVLLPVLGWAVAPRSTLLVLLTWSSTFYLGHALKDTLQLPRPHVLEPRVAVLEHHFVAEHGLPSTHAQAVWAIPPAALIAHAQEAEGGIGGGLTTHPVLWIAAALCYALLVSFSRVYLGVHSLLDVAAGALLGLLTCLIVVFWLGPLLIHPFLDAQHHAAPAVLLVLAVHVLLVLVYPRDTQQKQQVSTTFRDTCAILGVSFGVWASLRAALVPPLSPPSSLGCWLGRVVFGLTAVLAVHLCARKLVRALLTAVWPKQREGKELDNDMAFVATLKFVSYMGIGYVSLGVVPYGFTLLGL